MKSTFLILLTASLTSFAGDWPQWLGPTRNNHVATDEKPLTKLPPNLSPVWKIKIGGGFSSPIVANNKVIFCDENGTMEVAHQLDASTGKEIWQTPIASRFSDEWGAGPRSTPFIDGDRVYVQSCSGEFRCLNSADGKIIWGTSFEKDFSVKFLGSKSEEGVASRRGNNGSGLIDGDAVLVPVGGTNNSTLVCFDKLTGKVLWKTGTDEAAYSSPQIATIAGVKQALLLTADRLMAANRETGKELWTIPFKTFAKRHAATPVISGDDVVVNSTTIGLACERISKEGDTFKATEVWSNKNLKINLSTPVRVDDFLYSQGQNKSFVCVNAKTGELKWTQPGFGEQNSSTISMADKLLVLTDGGELILIQAGAEKYTELGRAQVCGKNWNFPAYADGRFYVRDAHELACYNLQSELPVERDRGTK
ncbi:MAG: PQQ-binding-like beta-propeller repeat protein [Verrucomicrobiota bacterium]